MKITAVETIPVRLPVGKFSDGMHKVWGTNAPERYDTGGPEKREELQGQGEMLLSGLGMALDGEKIEAFRIDK